MNKLFRSRNDRKVSGVLGGIANYFNIDATLVRLIFVILLIATGFMPFGLIYILAIYLMPEEE